MGNITRKRCAGVGEVLRVGVNGVENTVDLGVRFVGQRPVEDSGWFSCFIDLFRFSALK